MRGRGAHVTCVVLVHDLALMEDENGVGVSLGEEGGPGLRLALVIDERKGSCEFDETM